MEMRLRAPVTRGYFFLLGALRLVNAAPPRNIDQKKISSGTQGKVLLPNNWKSASGYSNALYIHVISRRYSDVSKIDRNLDDCLFQ